MASFAGVSSLSLSQVSPGPADRCALEESGGASSPWPASPLSYPLSCWLSLKPLALLAAGLWGQTSDGGERVCVLFCRRESLNQEPIWLMKS